jgi:hypothetical protein
LAILASGISGMPKTMSVMFMDSAVNFHGETSLKMIDFGVGAQVP